MKENVTLKQDQAKTK